MDKFKLVAPYAPVDDQRPKSDTTKRGRMITRIVCLMLLLALVFTSLFGCVKNEPSPDRDATNQFGDDVSQVLAEILLDKDLAEVSHLNGMFLQFSIRVFPAESAFSFDPVKPAMPPTLYMSSAVTSTPEDTPLMLPPAARRPATPPT